jgi:predicted acylesterase/phospholipase RssA
MRRMVMEMASSAPRRVDATAAGIANGSARPHTAFVLSGGASLGALHAGMLQALYERGIEPDVLVGTSAGALNAAFIASRPQTVATARQLGRIWRSLQREEIFPVNLSALVGGVCGRRDHLVPDRGLRRLVRRYIGFDDLAEATVPLHVVTFDLAEGREVLLSEGPALDSVAASASIPGVFPPVQIGDRLLIDGGVVNNCPISHAVELGADRIFVLPTQDPWAMPAGRQRRARRRDPRLRPADRKPAAGGHRAVLARGRADRAPGPEPRGRTTDELRALDPSHERSTRRRPRAPFTARSRPASAAGRLGRAWARFKRQAQAR